MEEAKGAALQDSGEGFFPPHLSGGKKIAAVQSTGTTRRVVTRKQETFSCLGFDSLSTLHHIFANLECQLFPYRDSGYIVCIYWSVYRTAFTRFSGGRLWGGSVDAIFGGVCCCVYLAALVIM